MDTSTMIQLVFSGLTFVILIFHVLALRNSDKVKLSKKQKLQKKLDKME